MNSSIAQVLKDPLAETFPAFSTPISGFPDSLAQLIATGGLEYVWDQAKAALADAMDTETSALVGQLDEWISGALDFEDAWSTAAGRLRSALRSRDQDALRAAVLALTLHLAQGGREIDWTGPMNGTPDLLVGSRAVPRGERIALRSANGTLSIRVDEGPEAFIFTRPSRHSPEEATVDILDAGTAAHAFPDLAADLSPETSEEVEQALREAMALLSHLPHFSQWVRRVLRTFVPLTVRDGTHLSRSFAHRPGLLCASCPVTPVLLGELLVHEATHQYLYLLGDLRPIEDGSDDRLYYSPVKGCGRPIFNILLAYHAFGNILLYHRDLISAGVVDDTGFSRDRIAQIAGYIPVLEQGLRSSPAISEAGHALWRTLAERCATEVSHHGNG